MRTLFEGRPVINAAKIPIELFREDTHKKIVFLVVGPLRV